MLIVAKSGDPDLVAPRNEVIARGGAVDFGQVSVAALSAMLPASHGRWGRQIDGCGCGLRLFSTDKPDRKKPGQQTPFRAG